VTAHDETVPAPPPAPGTVPPEPAAPAPGPATVDTSTGKAHGLDKCPRCGSTEIGPRAGTAELVCHYCRHQWGEAEIDDHVGFATPVAELRGRTIGSGAGSIVADAADVLTLKCTACGAEVVVNTQESLQARCHWCRHTLSVNDQLPNGAVPDGILPFAVTREDAIARISEFVKKRKFFAHPKFVAEFRPTEVVGVYLPYLVIDFNGRTDLTGAGEIKTGSRRVKRGDNEVTLYDADVYELGRSFDLQVDDLVLEASGDRADIDMFGNTNNVINAVQPFDVKEAVAYNAHYLRGFTSEKRDLDVEALVPRAAEAAMSIARTQAEATIKPYDRGVRWKTETLEVRGSRWVSVYLPVWLYGYYQERGGPGDGLLHYVAVNGRTGETMGSVPVRQKRLVGVSATITAVGTVVGGIAALFL
jgi:hypothetical protein